MFHLIEEDMVKEEIRIGRDRFFEVLREEGMLIEPRKSTPRTTYSKHDYAVAPNWFKECVVEGPGDAVVADITYVRVQRAFAYLFLVTDAFSRRIVGWKLSKDLRHEAAVEAIRQAIQSYGDTSALIHHSDRGCQYCYHEFLKELGKHGITASMTDADHCAQNAKAERVNGILKNECYLDQTFSSYEQARRATSNAILLYNSRRPHLSLNYKTPDEVHFGWTSNAAAA
jgi:transposase InsO family protein